MAVKVHTYVLHAFFLYQKKEYEIDELLQHQCIRGRGP
jgi:hypothetical protein